MKEASENRGAAAPVRHAAVEPFGLYVILTNPIAGYERCAEAAVAAGVRFLQLRMKSENPECALEMARRLRAITANTQTHFIVNDDPDLAAEVGADGVHLGQDDEPIAVARARHPGIRIWGLSTHDEAQAAAAQTFAPDYIGVGPVFPTPTKARPDPTLGLERMGRIVKASACAAVAIGGINARNLREVLAAGAVNFAVVRPVCESSQPESAIRELQAFWREFRECAAG